MIISTCISYFYINKLPHNNIDLKIRLICKRKVYSVIKKEKIAISKYFWCFRRILLIIKNISLTKMICQCIDNIWQKRLFHHLNLLWSIGHRVAWQQSTLRSYYHKQRKTYSSSAGAKWSYIVKLLDYCRRMPGLICYFSSETSFRF